MLTPRLRFLRGPTIGHLNVESEPSRLATSSATNSNPASVGSGDYSRRDEAQLRTLLLVVNRQSAEARAVAIRTKLESRRSRRKNALMVQITTNAPTGYGRQGPTSSQVDSLHLGRIYSPNMQRDALQCRLLFRLRTPARRE